MQLSDVVHISQYLERRALNPISASDLGPGRSHANWLFARDNIPKDAFYTDPDLEGTEVLPAELDDEKVLITEDPLCLPDMFEVESIVASLINQGLLKGFIAHKMKKFAIKGAHRGAQNGEQKLPAQEAGFPNIWNLATEIHQKGEVPGWKLRDSAGAGGMIVTMGAVKEIGS